MFFIDFSSFFNYLNVSLCLTVKKNIFSSKVTQEKHRDK